MKLNRFLLVSIFLLAILTLGAVSAAEDNATSGLTDVNDLDLPIQEVDETETGGGVDSDVAISDNVKDVEDSKLGASQEEVLKEPVNPTYTIDATDIKYGQVENVTVSIPGATGVVNMTCNNQVYSGTLIDGKITQQITNYVVGSNKLTVQYFGDDNYNPFTGTKNFRTSFDYAIHDANFGQIAFIELNLYDATGTVTFNLNSGADVVDVDLVNGSIIKEYKNYNVFKNTIVITYNGDERFNANQVTSNSFQARPIITKETVYNGQPEIITINLGEATGIVNVNFNGEVTQCPLVNGIATFETTDYAIGTNKFTYSYSGDDTFNAFDYQNYQATFTVLDKENSTIYSIVYKTPQKNVIAICIPHGNGTVNVTINGKKEVLELVDGVAEYAINPDDEINEINVTYAGSHRLNPNNSTGFATIKDNVVNNDNYMYYFNQIDGGKIFGFIEDGTTLDFQGSIINPDQNKMVYFDVSKPVNIISTTNDAYIDLNTTAGSLMGENPGNRFTVSYGGSWSNITGINFHNTQLWVFNTHHVVLDRVSNVIEDQRVGSGVGATSIRANSTWVTVKNSYFYTRNNGGSSSLVIAWADYCTFDNNTIVVEGNVGNMIYLTTYNVDIPSGVLANVYNNITNNRILAHDKSPAAICWGLVISGANNYVADNYIDYGGVGINQQWGQGSFINNTYTGNVLVGGASANFLPTSVVYNNTIEGTASTGANTVFFNNTVGKALTVGANAEAYDNTAGGLTLSGAGSHVHDNVINGATTITQANIVVENNTFLGDNSIKINNANAKNVTFANNDVVGYIEFGNKNAKGNIITGNNITTSKNYAIDLKTYTGTETVITDNILSSNNGFGNAAINHKDDDTLVIDNYQSETAGINITADDIYVGQTAVFNITCNVTSVSEVSVLVNNKQYTVKLVDGKGSLEVEDLLANTYTVRVSSLDETYGAQNSTTFTVSKNDCPEIVVEAPEKTQWIASDITVTIADATGTVKLSINGADLSADLVDGVAVLAVPDLAAGEYNFTIAYMGDYKYLGNQTNGTLKVNKNKEVKIVASDVSFDKLATGFSAQFTNYLGEAISGANVTFTIDGQTYNAITDENGVANVDLALTRGSYPVSIEFKAIEDEYDANSAEATITVIDRTVMDIASISGDCVITGSLKDILGAPIANAVVSYVIDGVETNTTTDANGIFNVQAKNNCNVSIIFKGDAISTPANKTIALSNIAPVAKDVVIEVKNANYVAVDTGAKEKGKMYYFTLKDTDGNNLTNKTVKVSFNGKVYTVTTNASGQAGIRISAAAAKTYNLNVFFMGDDDYKGATALAKINVAKKKTTIMPKKTTFVFKAAAKSKLVTATLRTTNKYLKAGKKVTITVNGKTYTAKTLSKGVIKLNIKGLNKKGKYSAKIRFAGDSTYKPVYSKFIKIVIQ